MKLKPFVGITCSLMGLKLYCIIKYVHLPMVETLVYYILTLLMLLSYAGTVFILPSFPASHDEDHSIDDSDKKRYCEKCDRIKPETFHHCSICSQCISHMDHHCPWTGNCVGLRTKKLFLLFLLYTSLSCLWFSYSVMYISLDGTNGLNGSILSCTLILSTFIGFLLFFYFWFHVYLLQDGRTTLDFISHRPGNTWGYSRNFQVYFGTNWLTYCIPIVPPSMWTDGNVDTSESTSFRV